MIQYVAMQTRQILCIKYGFESFVGFVVQTADSYI